MFHSNHEISGFHETWTPMGQYNVKTKYLSRHTYRVSKVLYQKGRTNRVSKVMMVIIIVMRRRRRRWWRRKMLKKMEKQKKTKITMVRHSWKWLTCREVLSHKEFCVSWPMFYILLMFVQTSWPFEMHSFGECEFSVHVWIGTILCYNKRLHIGFIKLYYYKTKVIPIIQYSHSLKESVDCHTKSTSTVSYQKG